MPKKPKVTFRIQKSRENRQSITVAADDKITFVRCVQHIESTCAQSTLVNLMINRWASPSTIRAVRYLNANKVAE